MGSLKVRNSFTFGSLSHGGRNAPMKALSNTFQLRIGSPLVHFFLLVVPYPRNTLELVCSQLHSINIDNMNNLKHLLQLLYEVLRILNDI